VRGSGKQEKKSGGEGVRRRTDATKRRRIYPQIDIVRLGMEIWLSGTEQTVMTYDDDPDSRLLSGRQHGCFTAEFARRVGIVSTADCTTSYYEFGVYLNTIIFFSCNVQPQK
jgi:hypothetical protein